MASQGAPPGKDAPTSLSLGFCDRIESIGAARWAALAADDNPFVGYPFLRCMERFGAAAPQHGWRPHYACLRSPEQKLLAVAPVYLKDNSHGEFVFDWSWAAAWEQAGGDYYPKLLCASPYSPICGPRLLAGGNALHARALTEGLIEYARRLQISSLHVNFTNLADTATLRATQLLQRDDWQFHWTNPGYQSFNDYLACLKQKRRKEIRRERRSVQQAGIRFRWVAGDQASAMDLAHAHALYRSTFERKGNLPVISAEGLTGLAEGLGGQLLFLFAERDQQVIAGAIFLRSDQRLYGRYWGCHERVRNLHFETCLYQGIEYCIDHQLGVFEPGAQGEHKFMRGFQPVMTHSFHWIGPESLRRGIDEYLQRERAAVQAYGDQLHEHCPYRDGAAPMLPAAQG